MRGFVLAACCSVAVLVPKTGNAQEYLRTPAPFATAATAPWQINGEPIYVSGVVFVPTRAFRIFDGRVMVQIGILDGVPVYADVTLEPYSVAYVPVGGDRMREYERRRDQQLAGTTGSRTPAFPVTIASEPPGGAAVTPAVAAQTVATSGRTAPPPPPVATTFAPHRRPQRTVIASAVRPSSVNGVWLDFKGARWYADGPAAVFTPERFEPVGDYHGFPVYREKAGHTDAIWVSVVTDGPVAPYKKR